MHTNFELSRSSAESMKFNFELTKAFAGSMHFNTEFSKSRAVTTRKRTGPDSHY